MFLYLISDKNSNEILINPKCVDLNIEKSY